MKFFVFFFLFVSSLDISSHHIWGRIRHKIKSNTLLLTYHTYIHIKYLLGSTNLLYLVRLHVFFFQVPPLTFFFGTWHKILSIRMRQRCSYWKVELNCRFSNIISWVNVGYCMHLYTHTHIRNFSFIILKLADDVPPPLYILIENIFYSKVYDNVYV